MAPIPKVASFINKSPLAQKVLRYTNDNPAVSSAIMSFCLASILRPTLIGCFNFKDKKDKRYSQGSSISAGLIELGSTAILFIPLNKCIANTSRALYNSKGSFYFHNNVGLRQFKSITNRSAKLLALIPLSLARFALVKPIVETLFGKDTKEKVVTVSKFPRDFESFRKATMKGGFKTWA